MIADAKTGIELIKARARRRGGIIVLLTCVAAPLGLLGWRFGGFAVGSGIYGSMMLLVIVLWIRGVREAVPRRNPKE